MRVSLLRWLLLAAALGCTYLIRVGERDLWDPDEGRYAEIAREMRASGDWVVPRLNGVVYAEKPPLLYWVEALSMEGVKGHDAKPVRLPVVLASLLAAAAVAWAARCALGPEAAFWAAGTYGACLYVFIFSRVILTDAFLTLGTAVLLAGLEWGRRRPGLLPPLMAGVGLAIGVLAKGPIAAALPCFGIVLECLVDRSLRPLHEIRAKGLILLVALVLILPWFILAARAIPGFLDFFVVHEHFQRFATPEARREQPWWFFVPVLLGGCCPWWGALIWGVRHGWRDAEASRPLRRGLAWALAVLLLFSASHSKLPSYLWPAFPPLALVMGWGLARLPLRSATWRGGLWALLVLGIALFVVSRPAMALRCFPKHAEVASWIAILAQLMVGSAVLGFLSGRFARGVLLAGFLAVVTVAGKQAEGLDRSRTARGAAGAILGEDPAGECPVVNHRGFRPSLAYYTRRRIVQWGSPGELTFGMNLLPPEERARWFFDTKADVEKADRDFTALWGGPGKVYLVMRAKDRPFVHLSPPGRELGIWGDDVVVANR